MVECSVMCSICLDLIMFLNMSSERVVHSYLNNQNTEGIRLIISHYPASMCSSLSAGSNLSVWRRGLEKIELKCGTSCLIGNFQNWPWLSWNWDILRTNAASQCTLVQVFANLSSIAVNGSASSRLLFNILGTLVCECSAII